MTIIIKATSNETKTNGNKNQIKSQANTKNAIVFFIVYF